MVYCFHCSIQASFLHSCTEAVLKFYSLCHLNPNRRYVINIYIVYTKVCGFYCMPKYNIDWCLNFVYYVQFSFPIFFCTAPNPSQYISIYIIRTLDECYGVYTIHLPIYIHHIVNNISQSVYQLLRTDPILLFSKWLISVCWFCAFFFLDFPRNFGTIFLYIPYTVIFILIYDIRHGYILIYIQLYMYKLSYEFERRKKNTDVPLHTIYIFIHLLKNT